MSCYSTTLDTTFCWKSQRFVDSEHQSLGEELATDAEIREVVRRARLTETVASLPKGFSTQVGERGLKLSGEKQRVRRALALA